MVAVHLPQAAHLMAPTSCCNRRPGVMLPLCMGCWRQQLASGTISAHARVLDSGRLGSAYVRSMQRQADMKALCIPCRTVTYFTHGATWLCKPSSAIAHMTNLMLWRPASCQASATHCIMLTVRWAVNLSCPIRPCHSWIARLAVPPHVCSVSSSCPPCSFQHTLHPLAVL